ncbi:hypothetical protein SUGI_0825220 [Cryptomeria japonica]|nr:hypothetical protein SUGI_0825220 [Cryptomeria japonica]
MHPPASEITYSTWSALGAACTAYQSNNSTAQGSVAPFHVSRVRDQMAVMGGAYSSASSSFSGFGVPLQLSYDQSMSGSSLVLQRKMTPQEIVEAKALAASKSHSEAERRRRERINAHLATLRSLLPSAIKTDKASLLAEVIEHVKELKRMASDIEQGSPLPDEADQVCVDSEGEGLLIRASLCCDDRPELLTDVIKTLRALRLRAVKAEMSTLGGRVKNVFLVTNNEDEEDENPNPSVSTIQEALKALLERRNSAQVSLAAGNKRQRQDAGASI